MEHLALCEEHWELTDDEILLNVLLKVSGRPLILGALHDWFRFPPDGPNLAWWKVPCTSIVCCMILWRRRSIGTRAGK